MSQRVRAGALGQSGGQVLDQGFWPRPPRGHVVRGGNVVGWALGAVVCRRPGSVCQRGQALGACQALARACRPLSVRPRIAPNRTATGASTGRSLASGRRGEATEQFSTCYERWRSLLWQGCVAAVIKELNTPVAARSTASPRTRSAWTTRCIGRCHWPIGSGVVESACKNVVAARMKQSGMMWDAGRRQGYMLQLRASVKSRRFWSDFENLLPSSPPQQTDQIHLEAA